MSDRFLYGLGFVVCVSLIGVALFFQYQLDLDPCPLCLIQRIIVMALGAVLLIAFLHAPGGAVWKRLYAGIITVISGVGISVAGRHVWLQNLPDDQVPGCGPGLEYILEAFPLRKAFDIVLNGSGECHEIVWSFLGLTIPGWTLVIFIVFFVIGIWKLFSGQPKLPG